MSVTAAMTLPAGRAVYAWWRDLAAQQPRRVWFAHLLLHRLEALVEAAEARPLAALSAALLERLRANDTGLSIAELASGLSLDAGLLHAALSDLRTQGLASMDADTWRASGTAAAPPPVRQERRSFVFSDGRSVFLSLPPSALQPLTPTPPGWRFDLAALTRCIEQPPEWKQQHGFPAEVQRLLREPDWRAVVIDHPTQVLLWLVEQGDGSGIVQGYGVRSDTWALSSEPVLRCPAEVVGELSADPGLDGWRQAWQVWCQQRSLPGAEVEGCKLEADGPRLLVRAPAKLMDRLRAARSDALKGEAWLLAGTGRVRPAAVVEMSEG